MGGKRSQKQVGLPSVIITCPEEAESKANENDRPTFTGISGSPQVSQVRTQESTRESDIFSMRSSRESLRSKNVKISQSVADFRLPEPSQNIDGPVDEPQHLNNLKSEFETFFLTYLLTLRMQAPTMVRDSQEKTRAFHSGVENPMLSPMRIIEEPSKKARIHLTLRYLTLHV